MASEKGFRDSVQIENVTEEIGVLSIAGPYSRDLLVSLFAHRLCFQLNYRVYFSGIVKLQGIR